MCKKNKDLIIMAIVNQLEKDFKEQEFESLDCLLTELLKSTKNRELFHDYLSDQIKEDWIEGKIEIKY